METVSVMATTAGGHAHDVAGVVYLEGAGGHAVSVGVFIAAAIRAAISAASASLE
jgi:hypothetical protein